MSNSDQRAMNAHLSGVIAGLAAPATLNTHDMTLYSQSVDSILRRFNDPQQRIEAGVSAALLLQAMSTMGVFKAAPALNQLRTAMGGVSSQNAVLGQAGRSAHYDNGPTPEEIELKLRVERETSGAGRALEEVIGEVARDRVGGRPVVGRLPDGQTRELG